MASTSGRRVVVPLTNKSGGGVIAGDVVVIDTANDDAFTTTTSAAFTGTVGIAQATIANNAVGPVLLAGEAALINVSASVTRGHYGTTHTVAKQAVSAGASRVTGTFVQFKTGGTTPKGIVFRPDLGAGSGAVHSTLGKTSIGASFKTARGTYVQKITLASPGLLTGIWAYVKGDGTNSTTLAGVIYSDTASAPINMILNATVNSSGDNGVMNTTGRWRFCPVGAWLAAGDYWIGVFLGAGADSRIQLAYDTGGTTGKFSNAATRASDSSVSALSDMTSGHEVSVYADIIR